MNETKIPYNVIAEKSGVSTVTVSRCLKQPELVKPATLDKVYKSIEALGGVLPANKVISPRARVKILAITPLINNPFYTDVIQGIQAAADKSKCFLEIMIQTINKYNYNDILKHVLESGYAGIILFQRVDASILHVFKKNLPIVQVSEFNDSSDISYVSIDNLTATKKLMRYIISLGKTKIAIFNRDPEQYTYAKLRLQGYKESLEQAHIPVDPNNIIIVPDGSFKATASAVAARIKGENRPEVIFCVSDIMAAAALRACALNGLHVPEDIMVAGFDNIDISVMTTPNITTISQPRHYIGFLACTELLSIIADPSKPAQSFVLETELILRESTDC